MHPKKLKALLIIGPGLKGFFIEVKNIYNQSDCLVIGNGEIAIKRDEISSLKRKLDSATRINIFAHGNNDEGRHKIGLQNEFDGIYTSNILILLNQANNNFPIYVHIWSCYAGIAADDIKYLTSGSVIVTHGSGSSVSISALNDFALKYSLSNACNFNLSPYQDFLNNVAMYSAQTSIFSTKLDDQIYNFKVEKNILKFIENPSTIL